MIIAGLFLAALLGAAAVDSTAPAQHHPDYWNAWGVVFVKATCDPEGHVLDAKVVQGTAAPAVLDSLVAVVKDSAFAIGRTWGDKRDLIEVVPFVTERHPRESERAGWMGMPEDIQADLGRASLDVWLRGMVAVNPDFSLEDFLSGWCGLPSRSGAPHYLAEPEMIRKREFGVLLDSPDGRWVLDPFGHGEVAADGRMGWGVDTQFTISDASTGDRVFYYCDGLTEDFWTAAWIAADRFLMIGETMLERSVAGRIVYVTVPMVLQFSPSAGRGACFLGPPVREEDKGRFRGLALSIREAFFPKVNWRD